MFFRADAFSLNLRTLAAQVPITLHGVTLGSMSAGAGYVLVHHWRNRGGLGHRGTSGDAQNVAGALVRALHAHGGQLRTGIPVVTLARQVGALPGADDYLSTADLNVRRVAEALGER